MLNIKGSLGVTRRRENPPELVCQQRSVVVEWKMSPVTNTWRDMERVSERWMHVNRTQQTPALLYIPARALLGKKHQIQFYKKRICVFFFPPD